MSHRADRVGANAVRYVIRRVGLAALQIAIVSAGIFAVFDTAPGDYFSGELENPQRSVESTAAMRRANQLDRSWFVRYSIWAASSLRGEFGTSIAYQRPVSELLAARMKNTIAVAAPALMLAWLAGLVGAIVAVRMRRWWSVFEPGAASAVMIPDVIVISALLWLVVFAGWRVDSIWLPIAGVTVGIAPVVLLHAGGQLRQAADLEFVRIAKSRGIHGHRLWLSYILPAAANPLISLAGMSLAAAIGSSFVAETLTGWPGAGPLFLEAVRSRDLPIVETLLTGLAAALIVGNLIADLALRRLDPRLRIPR